MLSQWRLVTELSTVQERFGDRDIKAKSVSHTVFVRWITVVSCYSGNSVLAVLCCSECHSKGTSYSNLSRGHLHPTDVFLSLLLPNKNRVFFFFQYTWVRASWIRFNNCPTRCDLFSLLYFCRQLYMFRVLTLIIRSLYNCNYSFWYWLTGSTTIRSRCWVPTQQRERMVVDPVNQ